MSRDTGGQGDSDGRDVETRRANRPGSDGEHVLQAQLGTVDRADAFYESAMQNALTDRMASFLTDRRLGFVGVLDGEQPLASPCVGNPGMVHVLGSAEIAWPVETVIGRDLPLDGPPRDRWLSLVTVDWWDSTVGLHVNGVGDRQSYEPPGVDYSGPSTDWYVLSIEESYIHCAKHIPRLVVDDEVPDDPATETTWTEYERIPSPVERFIGSRVLTFLVTADGDGETDLSPRLGPEGFIQILDDTTLAWPEYRGNGIHASMGNIFEQPIVSLLFVDWWNTEAVVRVSGEVSLRDEVAQAVDLTDADRTKMWAVLDVDSVTVIADPPLPKLSIEEFDPPWGTDDTTAKKSGFFTEKL